MYASGEGFVVCMGCLDGDSEVRAITDAWFRRVVAL